MNNWIFYYICTTPPVSSTSRALDSPIIHLPLLSMSIKENAAFQARSLVSTGPPPPHFNRSSYPTHANESSSSSARSFGSRISLLHTTSESTPNAGRKMHFENIKGSWERGKRRISYTKDWRSYRRWGCVLAYQESASEIWSRIWHNSSALHKWRLGDWYLKDAWENFSDYC